MVMLSLVTGQFFSSGLIIFGEMAMVAMALTIGRDLSVDTDTKTENNNHDAMMKSCVELSFSSSS